MRRHRLPMLVLGPAAFLAGALAVGGCAQSGAPDADQPAADRVAGPASSEATSTGDAAPTDVPAHPRRASRRLQRWRTA